jgi:small-conductance mechanosensitive channel
MMSISAFDARLPSIRRWRSLVIALAAGLLLLLNAAASANEALQTARQQLEVARGQLDRIEATLNQPGNRPRRLSELREQAEPARATLRQVIGDLEPLHAQYESRLKQLGNPPAEGQPPETPEVAADREQQRKSQREVDAALKQARSLAVRSDQIVERIDQQRRTSFANYFFARSDSPFNPALWAQAIGVLPKESGKTAELLSEWHEHIDKRTDNGVFILAIALSVLAIGAILFLRRLIYRRIYVAPPAGETPLVPRAHKALLALRDAVLNAFTAPLAAFAVVNIFDALGLFIERVEIAAGRLVSAILFVAIGRALALAVLAPGRPERRLPALSDDAARQLYRPFVTTLFVTGGFFFVSAFTRAVRADASLSIATGAVYAMLVAVIIGYALLVSRSTEQHQADGIPPWIRLIGWTAVIAIFVALGAGYIRFGSLIAERLVTAAVVLLALYLALAVIDAVLGEGLANDSPRRRALANTVGLRPKTLDLFAALFAGLLRALSALIAIFIVIGTLTTSAIDVGGLLDTALLGVPVGQTRISVVDILMAVGIFLIGLLVTRVLYRWLSVTVLPRTDVDSSLQNSIATIAGYIGIIIAITLALARLGVNLENIALVAGALSIGIGFGLQSIVSNFVSGLILLTERPIRVGDWIVVGQEEGHVRKISVRSTEIETFDRASVIVPNSDLITNTVKNWTHFNDLGRFTVPVGIAYDGDPDAVKELLLQIAEEHPQVLKEPKANVFFIAFGESSLNLELRGFVGNVNQAFGVRSDLHFEIFRRFRAAGIEIPFPQRDIHIRTAPTAPESDNEAESEPAPKRRR